MWKLIQGGLIGLVVWSNAMWHWTPNNYLAAILALLAARLATGVQWRLWHWKRGLVPPPIVPFGNNLRSRCEVARGGRDSDPGRQSSALRLR